MTNRNFFLCKVCGYDNSPFMPWGEDGKIPSYSICPCCGVEFGYEDTTIKSIENYRKKWILNGAPWFKGEDRPPNWSVENQLYNIGVGPTTPDDKSH